MRTVEQTVKTKTHPNLEIIRYSGNYQVYWCGEFMGIVTHTRLPGHRKGIAEWYVSGTPHVFYKDRHTAAYYCIKAAMNGRRTS